MTHWDSWDVPLLWIPQIPKSQGFKGTTLVLNLKFGRHVSIHKHLVKGISTSSSSKSPTWVLHCAELVFYWMPMCPHRLILFYVDAWDKVSIVFILFFFLDWLRVNLVPNSISMVHQSSTNVCDPLIGSSLIKSTFPLSLSYQPINQWVL
jgi:hypothetical protein